MIFSRPQSAIAVQHRAVSLAEAIISIVIVSVMLVASVSTLGAARGGTNKAANRARGALLAQQLMAEILSQSYEEPTDTPIFGRESESGGVRTDYDDVDDYDGWASSPPEDRDGTQLANSTGWQRSVSVAWGNAGDLSTIEISESGIKRIIVRVTFQGLDMCRLIAIRTRAADANATNP